MPSETAAALVQQGITAVLPAAVRALDELISAQNTHFTTGVGYAPVRVSINNTTGREFILSSLTVTSGKVVAVEDRRCPPAMICVPAHQLREWQVSSRVGAMYGGEGSATYSTPDGESWFNFTWDCGVGTGATLNSVPRVGGINSVRVQVRTSTGSGLNGLSVLDVIISE
jgi:hypothetical protein